MNDATTVPRPGVLSKVLHMAQWLVFAFAALLPLVALTDLRKVDAPDAPVTLLYITIGVALLVAAVHLPPLFFRLTRKWQVAAYFALLALMVLQGNYFQQMEQAWARTPEGAQEAAEQVKADRVAAQKRAQADAQAKAERDAETAHVNEQKQAKLEADRQGLCESIVPNVIALSKEGLGPTVIEINDVKVDYSPDPDRLACTGSAITARGDHEIDFGIRATPQGKDLVTMQLR